jgi:DNA-binding transcriptional regulator YiaG
MPVEAEELKRIRKELRLTQQKLAIQLGVARFTVSRWESGRRAISEPVARLVRLLQAEAQKPR